MRSNASSARDHVPPRAVHLAAVARRASSRSRAPIGTARADERDRHERAASRTRAGSARASPRPSRPGTTPPSTRGRGGRRSDSPRTRRSRSPPGTHSGFCQPSVEKGTMPASSQTSPTSGTRRTSLAALLAADRDARRPTAGGAPRAGRARRSRARASSSLDPIRLSVTAGAAVDRQRQPEEAAARDVPVAHVPQPVVHALAEVLGRPLDGRVRLEQLRPHLVDAR